MPDIKRKERGPAVLRVVGDVTLAAWGRSPFGPRGDVDDADGELVGGLRLHIGPDGRLYAVDERKPKAD
jgi:hypothetical protein